MLHVVCKGKIVLTFTLEIEECKWKTDLIHTLQRQIRPGARVLLSPSLLVCLSAGQMKKYNKTHQQCFYVDYRK